MLSEKEREVVVVQKESHSDGFDLLEESFPRPCDCIFHRSSQMARLRP